jgi:hypothetical protein
MTTGNRRVSSFTAGLSSGLLGTTGNAGYKAMANCPYAMKTQKVEKMEVDLELDGDDWSASCPSWKYKL